MSGPAFVGELQHRPHGEYRRPCPLCEKGPKDDALAVRVDERGLCWRCHRCGYTGAEMRKRHEVRPAPRQDVPARWSDKAERLWTHAKSLRGSIVETYLRSRGCAIPPDDGDLRFLPGRDDFPPAMLARVTDFATGDPMSLHFTKLRPDGSGKAGTERDKLLLRGHQKRGGCIRLWPDDAVTRSLCVAEGIESALSAARLHAPAWAAVDAGNLADLPVVNGIETLAVFADHDAAGIAAARKLVARWRKAGWDARAWIPHAPKADPNDVLRGAA